MVVLLLIAGAACASSRRSATPLVPGANGAAGPTTTAPERPTTTLSRLHVDIPLTGDPTHPSIEFFGDSITASASAELRAQFGPRYRVGIVAYGGAPTSWLTNMIAAAAKAPPDVVVINLGTNDAYCRPGLCDGNQYYLPRPVFNQVTVDHRLDSFYHAFPARTCVVFVNINTHNPSWGPENAALINAHLVTFPRVVDWDQAWRPSWFYSVDDSHPNAVGRIALAAMIAAKVATCPV